MIRLPRPEAGSWHARFFEKWTAAVSGSISITGDFIGDRAEAIVHELCHHAVLFKNKNPPSHHEIGKMVASEFRSFTNKRASDTSEEKALAIEMLVYHQSKELRVRGVFQSRIAIGAAAWHYDIAMSQRMRRIHAHMIAPLMGERALRVLRWLAQV